MDDGDDIRLELRVEPAPRPKQVAPWLAVAALVAWGAIATPYACIVSTVVPVLFTWLGYSLAASAGRAFTMRARASCLEISYGDVVERLEWSLIEEVKDTADGIVIPLTHGRTLHLPSALVPDRRALMSAMPEHVKLTVERSQQKAGETWKTVAIWIALMILFYAVTRYLGAE